MLVETSFDKNIILITIDCLRADHIHCMEYNKNITPTIDWLAKNGIMFSNAFANGPYTPYSVPSFLTSNIPPIPKRTDNIAQILRSNGYATAAFVPNPIIFSESIGGFRANQGFDLFDLMLSKSKQYRLTIEFLRMAIMKYFRLGIKEKGMAHKSFYSIYDKLIQTLPRFFCPKNHLHIPTAENVNKRAINWIKNQDNKFFLWVHYMDVHEPYAPMNYENQNEMLYLITKYRDFPNMLSKQEIQKLINLYDLELEYTDKALDDFLKELKKLDLLDKSIIILSSDHGDAFGEHGTLGHGGKFRAQLYDEFIHVPLIIHGLKEKGIVIDKQVQLLDLAPTICELLKISIPPSFFGESLFSPSARGLIAKSGWYLGYRTDNYKLIINKSELDQPGLYDLKDDPEEKNNIYNKNKKLRDKLESEMMALLEQYKKKKELLDIKVKLR